MLTMWCLLVGIWVVAYKIFLRAKRQERMIPLESLPVMFSLVMVIYITLPPLVWILQGGEKQRIFGYRLGAPPTADEYTHLLMIGFVFCISLAVGAWVNTRKQLYFTRPNIEPIPPRILMVCITLFSVNFLLSTGLQLTGLIRQAENYADSYLVIQQLPLPIRIILKLSGGAAFVSKITILVWLFQNWKTQRQWIYLVLLVTVVAFDPEAGRAGTFLTFLCCLILWNRFVKPLTLPQMSIVGLALVAAFLAAGIYRDISSRGSVRLRDVKLSLGEFEAPWANAIELYRAQQSGRLDVPFQLHFSELYNCVPAALLPFEKWGYSAWFLNEFYYEYGQAGGGLMFGLLAQLVIGFGWPDIIVRGFLLGWFLSWLTSYLRPSTVWWHYPALVYCAVWGFYSVRDSSFSIVANLVQVLATSIVIIQLLSGMNLSDLIPRKGASLKNGNIAQERG